MNDESENPLIEGLDPRQLFSEGLIDPSERLPAIAGYEIRSKLGEGGMGTVYRAWQESLGREVALKLVRPAADSDTSVFERLDREARAMASIEHPNIVEVFDFLQLEDGSAVIAMKLIEGETLRTLMERNSELPLETVSKLTSQISAALQAAHSAGVVHRDVKPENVLIDLQGNAHVTDFGLALPVDEDSTRLTRTGTSVGTLAYIAPEQMEGQSVDAMADQFSFGVLIYEMLTAVRPRGVIEPPHQLRKELSPKAGSILLKAMARKPAERWKSIAEFSNQLLPTLTPRKGIPRRLLLTGGVLGGGLAIAGGRYTFLKNSGGWIDLLPSTDIESAFSGVWERDGNSLTCYEYSVLPLPVSAEDLGDEYEILLELSQGENTGPYGICFQTQAGMLSLDLNHWSKQGLSGVRKINGVMLNQGAGVDVPMQPGEIYRFRLAVQPGEIQFYQQNTLLKSYPIRPGDEIYNFWKWPEDKPREGLALVSESAVSVFHRVAWRK